MNELLELQTGQVSFISGLMAGFSLSISAHIMRSRIKGHVATAAFLLFTVTALLFLIVLYFDVALSLRIAGVTDFSQALIDRTIRMRTIGTSAATLAFFIFITSIGILGWLQSKLSGIVTSLFALIVFILIWVSRSLIFDLGMVG
jgi:hypothetical protein